MNFSEISIKLFKLGLVSKIYLNKALKEVGLYNGQTQILHYVKTHPYCTQIELAKAMSVSPASIALTTKKLEKNKLLIKTIEENNLRCKHLDLTEEGFKAVEACEKIYDDCYNKMYSGFTKEEFETFISFVDKITINLTDEQQNNIDCELVAELMKEVESIDHGRNK